MIGRTFARGPFVAGLVERAELLTRPAHTLHYAVAKYSAFDERRYEPHMRASRISGDVFAARAPYDSGHRARGRGGSCSMRSATQERIA